MSNTPVFKTILGDEWNLLGEVVRKHYFLKPRSSDYVCVCGVMEEITHSTIAKLLIPFGLLFGAIVPYKGKGIAVDVHYNSSLENDNIYWDRVFKFSAGDFHFKSFMEPQADKQVIEFVRFGIGIKLVVSVEDKALVFRDVGYLWRLFGVDVPIPGRLLMGRVYVEERPLSDDAFTMNMTLTHGIFGRLFEYRGKFKLS